MDYICFCVIRMEFFIIINLIKDHIKDTLQRHDSSHDCNDVTTLLHLFTLKRHDNSHELEWEWLMN